jgi:hypothetical protein
MGVNLLINLWNKSVKTVHKISESRILACFETNIIF